MVIPRFGLPVDPAQWAAAALGIATLVWGARLAPIARRHERRAALLLALLAALLSWGYVAFYLRGGPRIIDATSYWLEARGISEGHVTWPAGDPETAVLGRFLVRSETANGARAAVLFPPGYPLLLALGFLVGTPLTVGPLLAAALVLATFALAREIARGSPEMEGVPLAAAALSAACGALRYHTADTMSHGLAALCFTLAVTFLLRAREGLAPGGWLKVAPAVSPPSDACRTLPWPARARAAFGSAALAGLFGGWLFATRPASGLAFAATTIVILVSDLRRGDPSKAADGDPSKAAGGDPSKAAVGDPSKAAESGPSRLGARRDLFVRCARLLVGVALGAVPFLLVYLAHQRLATGRWLVSTHAAHYALNDGPAGCFRYGFGDGIGCFGEHGDFVRANLPRGFGFVAAVKTTARRLWMHLVDAGNAEPLALLVPVGAALAWKRPGVRAITAATLLLIAAYVPFYFDGNYPGGGARLFADALPFEHVLLAVAAVSLGRKRRSGASDPAPHPERRGGASDPAPHSERRGGASDPAPHSERRGGASDPAPHSEHHGGSSDPARSPASGAWLVGLVLLGFGVRAGFDHAMLRDRDGGAPLFSQDALRAQGIRSGLLFVDTDAAFDLAFDPDARAATGVEVVRSKGGAFDALTWRARGSPEPAFVARFVTPPGGGRGSLEVRAYSPPITADAAIDAGALWPPRAQEGGAYALPVFAGGTCAAAERPLRVLATANGGAVRIGVPPIFASGRVVDIGLIVGPGSAAWRASLGAPSSAALVAAGPSSPSPSALVAAGPSSSAAGPSSPSPAALVAPSSSAAGPSPPSLSALVAPSSSAGLGASVDVALEVDGVPLARGRFALPFDGDPRCLRALSVAVPAGARRVDIRVTAGFRAPADPELQPLVALDRIVARSAAVPGPPPPEGP